MKNNKRKLTKQKTILAVIASLIIVAISIVLIIQKINENNTSYWQEIVLGIFAIIISALAIYTYNKTKTITYKKGK